MACCLTAPSHYLNQCINHRWGLVAFIWEKLYRKCSRYLFLIMSLKTTHLRLEPYLTGANELIACFWSNMIYCPVYYSVISVFKYGTKHFHFKTRWVYSPHSGEIILPNKAFIKFQHDVFTMLECICTRLKGQAHKSIPSAMTHCLAWLYTCI